MEMKKPALEFHGNRRRTRGNEGKRLGRLRSEVVERSFAMFKRSGNLGRLTLRGLENVSKRCLIHAAAYNLGLVMRAIFGQGTPRGMADALGHALGRLIFGLLNLFVSIFAPPEPPGQCKTDGQSRITVFIHGPCPRLSFCRNRGFSTGC
ncbi:MAG: hypothetical protein EYX74_03370 [Desulfobulbaceae bacterium]|nr:MAG: hypothetical protein EYX74_03370 [Desulfobulbaceae bacterium]